MAVREIRFDVSTTLPKAERTPQGALRVPARLTRTGVFTYNTNGKRVRELRTREDVAASAKSFAGAPVTIGHSCGMVTADSWKQHAVGHVGDTIRNDGKYLEADILIHDPDTIAKVENRELKELSCGYSCDLEPKSGTHEGEDYDCVQKNIVGNHVALGPQGFGRAGRDVAIRGDGNDVSSYSPMMFRNTLPDPEVTPETAARLGKYECAREKFKRDSATAWLDSSVSTARGDSVQRGDPKPTFSVTQGRIVKN